MALEAGLGKKYNTRYGTKFLCRLTLKYQLKPNFHGISVVDFQETDKFWLQSREYGRSQKICSDKATYKKITF